MASAVAFRYSRVSAAPVPTKVGIVNIQEAILSTDDGKREGDALQKRFAPKQAALKQAGAEMEALQKKLKDQGTTMTPAERKTATAQLEAKQKKLQRDFTDAQQEFQQAEQDVFTRVGTKMMAVLKDYSQKNEYAVVLDVSTPQSPVLYVHDGANITKDLVAAYNAQSAKPAVPAAPTPQTPTPQK